MKVQNLGFKANNKRNGKSYGEKRGQESRLERKANVNFKLRRERQALEMLETYYH